MFNKVASMILTAHRREPKNKERFMKIYWANTKLLQIKILAAMSLVSAILVLPLSKEESLSTIARGALLRTLLASFE